MKSIKIIHRERTKQKLETRQLKSPFEIHTFTLISEKVRQVHTSEYSNKIKIGPNTIQVLIVNHLS